MNHFPQDADHLPGTWKGLQTPDGRSASFTCPNGHIGSLEDHDIGEDGKVWPSVICHEKGCDFHLFIILSGWTP